MKKSTSEEDSSNSKEKRPLRIIENETLGPNGKKTIVQETFFDDGTYNKSITVHNASAKTLKELGPEIVRDIHDPSTSQSLKRNGRTLSGEIILTKKEIDSKPEIVRDINTPSTSQFLNKDSRTLSGEIILTKKGIDSKPEIVTDQGRLPCNPTTINDDDTGTLESTNDQNHPTQNDPEGNVSTDTLPQINDAVVVKTEEEKKKEELDRIKEDLENNAYVVKPEHIVPDNGTDFEEKRRKKRKKTVLGIAFLTCVIAAITVPLAVLLTRKRNDPKPTEIPSSFPSLSPSISPSISPSDFPSSMPSLNPTSTKFTPLKQVLIKYTSEEPLMDSSTPQYKALEWLADTDTYVVDPTNYDFFLAQRYALATFFFSTGGNESWTNDNKFLSDTNECDWIGIQCYTFNAVKTIDISKFLTHDKYYFFVLCTVHQILDI